MEVFTSVEKAQESEERAAYIAHRDGYLLYKNYGKESSPMQFSVTSKVSSANSLEKVDEGVDLVRLKPIPFGLIARCIALFRRVYKEYGTEMIALFRWDAGHQRYYLDRPKFGCIGGAYLKYHQGGMVVGTIHSHGNMGAFFSGTDDKHEMEQAGVYLVAGSISSNPPALVASIAGQGKRLKLGIPKVDEKYFDEEISDAEYEWWMEPLQVQSHIQGRQKGWYIVDSENDICFWTRRKTQGEALLEPGYELVKAKKYKRNRFNAYQNATGGRDYGRFTQTGFDYDGYYGADRTTPDTAQIRVNLDDKQILTKFIQKINEMSLWQEFLEIAKEELPQSNFEDFLIQCAEHIETEFPESSGREEEDARLAEEDEVLEEITPDEDEESDEEEEDGTAEDVEVEEEEEEDEDVIAPIGFGEHPSLGFDGSEPPYPIC